MSRKQPLFGFAVFGPQERAHQLENDAEIQARHIAPVGHPQCMGRDRRFCAHQRNPGVTAPPGVRDCRFNCPDRSPWAAIHFQRRQSLLDFGQAELWIALAYLGVIAGPTGTWAAVSVARALPPLTASLGMLGTPLLAIASSVALVGEPVTWPLVLGTMLVISGIAIVIVERAR